MQYLWTLDSQLQHVVWVSLCAGECSTIQNKVFTDSQLQHVVGVFLMYNGAISQETREGYCLNAQDVADIGTRAHESITMKYPFSL